MVFKNQTQHSFFFFYKTDVLVPYFQNLILCLHKISGLHALPQYIQINYIRMFIKINSRDNF